ncbi:hypothetical protein [Sphingomonas aurantiaca]|uniref:hypothetical protein n=1 Tax=Sphingomonas aurantiaca TaxID=185949 RepID=UPI00125F125F|nr:hypothetical protein [Sphingomonas aurantiaca]
MSKGLTEGEIKSCIVEGGRLRNVLVVSSSADPDAEHLAYIRPSWKRGFLPLRTWGDKENRTYRDLDRLLVLIRQDFSYRGVVPLYVQGDPDMPRYSALASNAPSSSALLDRLEQDGTPPRPDD